MLALRWALFKDQCVISDIFAAFPDHDILFAQPHSSSAPEPVSVLSRQVPYSKQLPFQPRGVAPGPEAYIQFLDSFESCEALEGVCETCVDVEGRLIADL
jgi:hypothetical protein